MLQRLATAANGRPDAQNVVHRFASPTVEEAQAIFRTRALLEVANLPDVLTRCQPPHLAALEAIIRQEQQAHETL
ncbi:transcriptional regulator [Klebsiella michiganensis]|uniref:Transcriptional regulator n=1 Tax=Klebsiella michiganensis TaxID=1134687 RepID=A0A7H4N1Z0_9ENTR|nr:transcriptional regulator [Klebsiella michiganensis]